MSLKTAATKYDPRRWSLQVRLTVFFAIATTAILLVVSSFLYDSLRRQFKTEDEMELMQATKIIGKAVHSLSVHQDPQSLALTWEHTVASRKKLLVRAFTPDGNIYIQTENMPIPSEAFPPAEPPEYVRWWDEGKTKRYLLTSFIVQVGIQEHWHVEAAYDLTQSRAMLRTFKQQLALILVLALAITLALSWIITSLGLRPLRKVGNAIHTINPDNLSHRIGDHPWPAELAALGLAFDDMLARLEAAFAQLSRFSADLAHEVRTPVNNLLTAASVTLARDRDKAEYEATLESILSEGEHLARLVESMLFLARAENAKDDLQREELTTSEEFQLQLDFFELLAAEHEVTLSTEGNLPLSANPELLRRALSNLMDNAIRHTPAGGTVHLAATPTSTAVEITVTDTGVGISPHHQEHIFERFYRVDASRSKRSNTGLGLALVQSIMALHGGAVTVRSNPGEGTRFTLRFPNMSSL